MAQIVDRRRYMGEKDMIIMTKTTNPEVLAICYAQGWCAHEDYMTQKEASKVKDIDNAFVNNTEITHFLEFEHFGVTSLKRAKGFNGCTSLKSISIPSTLRSVEYQSFLNCTNLEKVVISDMEAWLIIDFSYEIDNPISYAHHIYSDENTLLTTLAIPSTITKLGRRCLSGWKDITSIVIPNNIISVGTGVFTSCTSLSSVIFSDNMTTIPSQMLLACAFSGVFDVPEGITSVEQQWIWDNKNITRLELPSTITSIGSLGIHYTTGNKTIVIKAVEPPIYTNSRSYIGNSTKIYVPDESVEVYKTSQYWSNLEDLIYPISDLAT